MTPRRKSASRSLAVKAAELAFAVPQVVAHRVARIALATPRPSARDRKEFTRMVAEKHVAFGRSWSAMGLQASLAHQALTVSFFRSFMSAAPGRKPSAVAAATRLHEAALGVLERGVAPVHRTAVANAKRLARTRLR